MTLFLSPDRFHKGNREEISATAGEPCFSHKTRPASAAGHFTLSVNERKAVVYTRLDEENSTDVGQMFFFCCGSNELFLSVTDGPIH